MRCRKKALLYVRIDMSSSIALPRRIVCQRQRQQELARFGLCCCVLQLNFGGHSCYVRWLCHSTSFHFG